MQTAGTQAGSAQKTETPPLARSIIDQSMSPFCPGLTLQACPSPSADSLRKDIVARVQAGESKDAILNRLYTDFGSAIRGAPETSGFGLVAWIAPGFVLLAAALLLTRWLRTRTLKSRRQQESNAPSRVPFKPEKGFSAAEHGALNALLKQDK